MSEFDKEEEREKLRKKFEREEERRQVTEQMSELLLKGATMLNIHCADCASPLFRHEGEEFCPTCGRTVGELQAAGDTADPEGHAAEEAAEPDETTAAEHVAPSREEPVRPDRTAPQTNAGEALAATIARLADRAATADDPRQAKELLEAAKAAAETLALVEGRDPR